MKGKAAIIAIICILILGGVSVYFVQKNKKDTLEADQLSSNNKNKETLLNVLNNKAKLIDTNNKEILFENYEIPGSESVQAKEYTFVDLDGDANDELVIYTTSDYGAYIILHAEKDKVYGYLIGIRSLEDLKTDGYFMGSNGSNSSEYAKMSFNKNNYNIEINAIFDNNNNIYKINNQNVSKKEIEEYIENWNKKGNVKWTQFENK